MSNLLFSDVYQSFLLKLLKSNTISPMETGKRSNIPEALHEFSKFSERILGFKNIYFERPYLDLTNHDIPITILDHVNNMGDEFFNNQPNMVLELGESKDDVTTIMFNFHIDTVDGFLPVTLENDIFYGRGAVDMKGPAVALLAGIAAAVNESPSILKNIRILIQAVSGEEGGAMGVYGTKILCEKGYLGDLNIFVEPTEDYYFDRSTSTMTLQISVNGKDSTDDAPHLGDNSTLLLGYLAQNMLKSLSSTLNNDETKICLSGIHTGHMHNKVYGNGTLKFNFAYATEEAQQKIEVSVLQAYESACKNFILEFKDIKEAQHLIKSLKNKCEYKWIKKGLPVLNNRNDYYENILNEVGLKRLPKSLTEKAFTCDAMWAQQNNNYTIVYGPGSLAKNNAHGTNEFIELLKLEKYSQNIKAILLHLNNCKTRGIKYENKILQN